MIALLPLLVITPLTVVEVAEILVIVLMFTVAKVGVASFFMEQPTIDVIAYIVRANRRVIVNFFCMMLEDFVIGMMK